MSEKRREREYESIPAPTRPRCARCGAVVRVTYTQIVGPWRRCCCDCQVCDIVNVYTEKVSDAEKA